MSEVDRAAVKARATEVAFDTGQECPTCGGNGTVPGGRRVIHSMAGTLGDDWSLERVLEAIDYADEVNWSPRGWLEHRLELRKGDRVVYLQVDPPAEAQP